MTTGLDDDKTSVDITEKMKLLSHSHPHPPKKEFNFTSRFTSVMFLELSPRWERSFGAVMFSLSPSLALRQQLLLSSDSRRRALMGSIRLHVFDLLSGEPLPLSGTSRRR